MIRLILFFILLSLNLSYSADYSVNQFIEELLSSHKQKKILQLKKDVTQNEYKQSKGSLIGPLIRVLAYLDLSRHQAHLL